MNLSFKNFRRSGPMVNGKAIEVRKSTGYQYAGPVPADPLKRGEGPKPVPGYPGLFHNPQTRMGMAHGVSHLSPGAHSPVTLHPDTKTPSPGPAPTHGSPARRNMETLSYYERNFPEKFHTDPELVPRRPKGTVDATEADAAAVRQFDAHVQAEDPKGRKRFDGEFGASLHRNGDPVDNFHAYMPGGGVNVPIPETTGARYDIHTHPYDVNKPPASAGEEYTNAGCSRFPSPGDYLAAGRVTVNAEQLGHVPPKYFMTTEGNVIQYSDTRMEFDAVRLPPAGANGGSATPSTGP